MKFFEAALVALVSLAPGVRALAPAEWRSQSIYQVLTDRFAQADGSTTVPCNTENQVYCGGTWQGITNNLDYVSRSSLITDPFKGAHYFFSPDPKHGVHSSKSTPLTHCIRVDKADLDLPYRRESIGEQC